MILLTLQCWNVDGHQSLQCIKCVFQEIICELMSRIIIAGMSQCFKMAFTYNIITHFINWERRRYFRLIRLYQLLQKWCFLMLAMSKMFNHRRTSFKGNIVSFFNWNNNKKARTVEKTLESKIYCYFIYIALEIDIGN